MMKRVFGIVSVVLLFALVSSIIFMGCEQAAELTARLYIGGYSTAKIYVINPDLEELVTTIDLPAGAEPDWLTLSPDNKKLYCSSASQNKVYIIDTVTVAYEKEVSVCPTPHGIAFTTDGTKAVVGCYYDMSIIDVATGTYVNNDSGTTISGFFTQTNGIEIHPTNNRFYAAMDTGIIAYAPIAGTDTVSTYTVGNSSEAIIDVAIHPNGSAVYATGWFAPDVYVKLDVNQTTGAITGDSTSTLSDYYSLGRIGITPNGQTLYAPIYSDSRIDYFSSSDINTVNNVELSPYLNNLYFGAQDVTFSDNSSLAFVVIDDVSDDKIIVIQTSDNTVLGTIDIPECEPRSIVYKP